MEPNEPLHPSPNSGDPDPEVTRQEEGIRRSLLTLFQRIRNYLTEVLEFKEGTEIQETIDGIKRDIDFKGHKAWILACSIFIASIGLNVNAPAAIIGAMLISPLMGPILGMGLAIGTHDFKTLTRSARSLATAVGISLFVSTLYFLISPIDEAQSELLARIRPTLLDVFVASFGGLAGIIAGSRKEKSNVIPGVAIATALMPPLCTAGFGLANLKWDFFFGAFYLFLLNSIFICLATWLIVRYLGFPKVDFLDRVRERKYNLMIITIVVVIVLPSAWLFVGVIRESIFNSQASTFVAENFRLENQEIVSTKFTYDQDHPRIDIYMMGEPLSEDARRNIAARMPDYGLDNCELQLHQGGTSQSEFGRMTQEVRVGIIEEMYTRNERMLTSKDSAITALEKTVQSLQSDTIPFRAVEGELTVSYPGLTGFSYAKLIDSEFDRKPDTIPTFILRWDPTMPLDQRARESARIEKWLRVRLQDAEIRVISY